MPTSFAKTEDCLFLNSKTFSLIAVDESITTKEEPGVTSSVFIYPRFIASEGKVKPFLIFFSLEFSILLLNFFILHPFYNI